MAEMSTLSKRVAMSICSLLFIMSCHACSWPFLRRLSHCPMYMIYASSVSAMTRSGTGLLLVSRYALVHVTRCVAILLRIVLSGSTLMIHRMPHEHLRCSTSVAASMRWNGESFAPHVTHFSLILFGSSFAARFALGLRGW